MCTSRDLDGAKASVSEVSRSHKSGDLRKQQEKISVPIHTTGSNWDFCRSWSIPKLNHTIWKSPLLLVILTYL